MIKSVSVTNYLGETFKMELRRPERTGIAIQRIDGLGPGQATINTNENATGDGSHYNSARLNSRNIVFSLAFIFTPTQTIEEVRQKVYKYFPIKKKVKLVFETDKRTSEIYGYVETNEPDIFSSQQTTQISIICPNPYFYSVASSITVFSGVDSIFEFPFSNESLNDNLTEISALRLEKEQTVFYKGHAEVGFVINIHALGIVGDISIYNLSARQQMKLISSRIVELTGEGIHNGDDIIISSVKGDKFVYLIRDGHIVNILNCLERGYDWFLLSMGDNILAFSADSGVNNLQFMVENRIAYEGV